MASRCASTVWIAWLGLIGLSWVLVANQVWRPGPIGPLVLLAVLLGAGAGLVGSAGVRLIRGPGRARALAVLLIGTVPGWFGVGHVLMALRSAFDRHVPPGWAAMTLLPTARSILDLEARWVYPERTAGRWVTMVGATTPDARGQVAAMDRHVDALLARLHQPTTGPIVWYRGTLLGLGRGGLAVHDMAFGTEAGTKSLDGEGVNRLDRHEIAHCVLDSRTPAQTDPPRLLMEGWAEANQGTTAEDLAQRAWDERLAGRDLTLRQLVAPDWYWYSGWSAYVHGAPLVNYLVRVYGVERFLKLYSTCGQATFDADLRRELGIGLDALDAAYWADIQAIVARTGPPARRWLKGLKLDPSITPDAWNTFLAAYFAAAEQMVAPYDHVRLTTTYQNRSDADRHQPGFYEERLTLLRSGPFARIWRQDMQTELAALATPDQSIGVSRDLHPSVGAWTFFTDEPGTTREQSYRRTLRRINRAAANHGFLALHGGAVLLEYPQNQRDMSIAADFEVIRLESATIDGHPTVTLGLRSLPTIPAKDQQTHTFHFAADDSYVVRSMEYITPTMTSTCKCQYNHADGRPVFRSYVTTIPGSTRSPARTVSLNVEQCEFGPIPAAEFAVEPFLNSLKPGRGYHPPASEPASTATLLDWYWLAFVGGGLSLTGGIGLAVSTRLKGPRT